MKKIVILTLILLSLASCSEYRHDLLVIVTYKDNKMSFENITFVNNKPYSQDTYIDSIDNCIHMKNSTSLNNVCNVKKYKILRESKRKM